MKMDYKCRVCKKEFNDISKTFHHLRSEHKTAENNERIKCIVNFQKSDFCERSYLTFSALRGHVKSCVHSKHKQHKEKVNSKYIRKSIPHDCYVVLYYT